MHKDIKRILQEGRVKIPEDLSVFRGHFPKNPIVPGIYLLDIALRLVEKEIGKRIRLHKITKCKFIKPVFPNMELTSEIKVLKKIDNVQKIRICLLTNKEIVTDINFSVTIIGEKNNVE